MVKNGGFHHPKWRCSPLLPGKIWKELGIATMKNGDENDEIGLNLENLELLKFESAWL
jgi:hypothetical protein